MTRPLSTTAGDLGDALVGYSGPEIEYRGWIIRGHISGYTATGPEGEAFDANTMALVKTMIDAVAGPDIEDIELPDEWDEEDQARWEAEEARCRNDDGYRPDDALWTERGWPGNVEEE